MAKIYYKKYLEKIINKEMTVDEAIEDAKVNVPIKWRNEVIRMLSEINEDYSAGEVI